MRRYVTPSLIVDNAAPEVSARDAVRSIKAGREATVSSDSVARSVLKLLGLTQAEISFRLESS